MNQTDLSEPYNEGKERFSFAVIWLTHREWIWSGGEVAVIRTVQVTVIEAAGF